MKKLIFFSLVFAIMIGGCAQEKKSPVEGVWKMVSAKWIPNDTTVYLLPENVQGSQIKIWQNGYVTLAGNFKIGTTSYGSYCAATYKLDGNKYVENVIYHDYTVPEGTSMKQLLEIRNDTLIQMYPVDDDWKLLSNNYMWEKYIKLK